MRTHTGLFALLAALLLAACGDDGTGPRRPAQAEVLAGNGQASVAGATLLNPLSVRVLSANGDGVRGVTVMWAAVSGGGSFAQPTSMTDASGIATAQWTVGGTTGSQTATASVEGLAPVPFTATVSPATAARIRFTPDSVRFNRLSGAGTRVGVEAVDAFGNVTALPGIVTYTNLDPTIAIIAESPPPTNPSITVRTNGRARIEARSGTLADTLIVRVQQIAVSGYLTASPRVARLEPGDTIKLIPIAYEAGSSTLIADPRFVWASSVPSVGTVDQTGLFTAVTAGTTVISATTDSVTLGLTVTVQAGLQVSTLATGGQVSCGLAPSGAAFCWGTNGIGQLGVDRTPQQLDYSLVPLAIPGLTFSQITAGDTDARGNGRASHICAVTTGGAAYCWGYNESGQVGNGTLRTAICILGPSLSLYFSCIDQPVEVAGGHSWRMVSAGGTHTCGVTRGNTLYCWGRNTMGQLGAPASEGCLASPIPPNVDTYPCSPAPVAVAGTFSQVSAGDAHTCALTASGAAYCWGANSAGQLGNGTTTAASTPAAVATGLRFASISAGRLHTCARTDYGAIYCWGSNGSGQLGTAGGDSPTPVRAGGTGFAARSVSAGRLHTCALGSDNRVFCWGSGTQGQLGNGGTASTSTPVPAGNRSYSMVTAGGNRTCAIGTAGGLAYCWGNNDYGAVGAVNPDAFEQTPRQVRGS